MVIIKQRQQTKYNWILTSTNLLTEIFTVIERSADACILDTKISLIDLYNNKGYSLYQMLYCTATIVVRLVSANYLI